MDNNTEKYFRKLSRNKKDFWLDHDSEVIRPSLYKVFLKYKGPIPPEVSEFYFAVLTQVFRKSKKDAENDLATIQKIGRVFCGLYTKEVAETKMIIAKELAYNNSHNVDFIMQKGRQNVIEES